MKQPRTKAQGRYDSSVDVEIDGRLGERIIAPTATTSTDSKRVGLAEKTIYFGK
jgi:hypothetical protein